MLTLADGVMGAHLILYPVLYVFEKNLILSHWKFGISYSNWHYLRDTQGDTAGFIVELENEDGSAVVFYASMTLQSVAGREVEQEARKGWRGRDVVSESVQTPTLNGDNGFFWGSDSKTRKEGKILHWWVATSYGNLQLLPVQSPLFPV